MLNFNLDCPRGWYLYAGYCYTVSNKSYDFDDTEWDKGCSSKSLVSINSPHEQAFVLSLLAGKDSDVWIGLTRRRNTDEFRWFNGDPMTYAYIYAACETVYVTCACAGMLCGRVENRVLAVVVSALLSTLTLATGRRSTA